jgi:hypothetical protein
MNGFFLPLVNILYHLQLIDGYVRAGILEAVKTVEKHEEVEERDTLSS